MNRILVLVGLLALCAAPSGCGSTGPRACTEIGCSDGLTVVLEGASAASFTVTATAEGRSEMRECESTGCVLFFQDFTPAEVTITYASGDREVVETFSPEYRTSRPNGEGCPPECLQATVTLVIP